MKKKYTRSLFIFRRDLRLEDNPGLNYALEHSEAVIACFIFTKEQIENNAYLSEHCLQFMIESLEDLENQLKKINGRLYLFYGSFKDVIEKCLTLFTFDCVVVNKDYTPFSTLRDQAIQNLCDQHSIFFKSFDDALLNAPEETLKANGKPYTIFTPFFRNASKLPIDLPKNRQEGVFFNQSIPFSKDGSIYQKILPQRKSSLAVKGGRSAGLSQLKEALTCIDYPQARDFPEKNGTTYLSAYLKFNVLSIREVYHTLKEGLGKEHELIRSLYWRDFFSMIGFFFPHVFEGCFNSRYDRLSWKNNEEDFKKWCLGKTGFPLVDAGQRELNETGFMHNRVRMISASFLIKDLHIDWRWGEKYFARKLIDYDPAVNNGNWQWAASTGCDAVPYFRIFNPWRQQEKFDPNCVYIKKWISELSATPISTIQNWNKEGTQLNTNYPPPLVDHTKEAAKALEEYKKLRF